MTAKWPGSAGPGEDGFNFVRMFAACAVLFSHCFVISSGQDINQPLAGRLWGITLGSIAVDAFFVISGFLVCGSLLARHDLRSFWKARLVRVYPGVLVSIALTIVSALICEQSQLGAMFTSKFLWMFLVKNSVLIFGTQTKLPLVFDSVPYPAVANGSLWTLPFEVRLYFGLGMLWLAIRRLNARRTMLSFERSLLFIALTMMITYALASEQSHASLRFTAFFAGGAACYAYRRYIPLRFDLFFVCAAALVLSATRMEWYFVVYTFTLPYLVLYLAYAPIPGYKAYNKFGDYSYGMYIYAFPVQQFIAKAIPGISAWRIFPLAMGATFALAFLSWHLIEQPALRLKSARAAQRGFGPDPGSCLLPQQV